MGCRTAAGVRADEGTKQRDPHYAAHLAAGVEDGRADAGALFGGVVDRGVGHGGHGERPAHTQGEHRPHRAHERGARAHEREPQESRAPNPQPHTPPWISPNVRPPSATMPGTWAVRSKSPSCCGGTDGTSRSVSRTPSTPTGRFTRNTLRQVQACVRMPPTTGPAATATPVAAAQMPIAWARSDGS